MASIVRGPGDKSVQAIKTALEAYEKEHPDSAAALYRQNNASIRVRVIDRRFEGMTKSRRHDKVWNYLAEHVSEDILSDISLLLPIPPSEQKTSLMNLEFEDPMPSGL